MPNERRAVLAEVLAIRVPQGTTAGMRVRRAEQHGTRNGGHRGLERRDDLVVGLGGVVRVQVGNFVEQAGDSRVAVRAAVSRRVHLDRYAVGEVYGLGFLTFDEAVQHRHAGEQAEDVSEYRPALCGSSSHAACVRQAAGSGDSRGKQARYTATRAKMKLLPLRRPQHSQASLEGLVGGSARPVHAR